MESRSNWIEGEHVDIRDSQTGRWVNGEIEKIDQQNRTIKVSYSGTNGFKDTVPMDSDKIQKQWKSGMKFQLNNRLDIYDINDKKWREAHIIEIKGDKIQIHYRGYTSKYDEWIDTSKDHLRIKEVGSYSGAEGAAKYSQRHQQELQEKDRQLKQQLSIYHKQTHMDGSGWGLKPPSEFDLQRVDWKKEEEKFISQLYKKGLRICEMDRDGNCMFRAIAHQTYGDMDLHKMIRQKCMDYILSEKNYYKDFIFGDDSNNSVETYVYRKRLNAVWGDDIEIQALSEIYNRPIEIYAYSDQPMKTFHEQDGSSEPIRLSYHGRSHYNSVVPKDWNYEKIIVKSEPGEIEDEAIAQSKMRVELEQQINVGQNPAIDNREQQRTVQNIRLLAQIIQRSREDFKISNEKDMEQAFKQSMQDQLGGDGSINIENQNIQRVMQMSQLQMTEEEMIKLAMEQSLNEEKKSNQMSDFNLDDAVLKTVLEMSNKDQLDSQEMNPTIKIAIENGFTLEQAIEAYSVVGDNPDMVMNYLFDTMLKIK